VHFGLWPTALQYQHGAILHGIEAMECNEVALSGFYFNLPPTTEEVNAIAHDRCLSVIKITQKRMHGFR